MIRPRASPGGIALAVGLLAACTGTLRGIEPYQPVPSDPLLEPWRWTTFPELNGRSAQSITEGKDGALWFGTPDGVWRFDGVQWVFHATDQIGGSLALCPEPNGSLLVCGQRGINRLSDNRWERVFPPVDKRFGDLRKVTLTPEGTLWVATAWGALHLRDSRRVLHTTREIADRWGTNLSAVAVTAALLPDAMAAKGDDVAPEPLRCDFSDVCLDRRGRVWLATENGDVLRHDPATAATSPEAWVRYTTADGLSGGRLPSILALQDGGIWVVYGGESTRLDTFDGTRWQPAPLPGGRRLTDCSNPLQTRDGVVWLSSRYAVHACREGRWRSYEHPEVPIPTARNFVFQSADGALWIGGPGTEVHRIDYQTPRWRTFQDLNFQWESPDGTQWFLQRSGRVVRHDARGWVSQGVEDGLIDTPVALLGTARAEVWVAGSHQHTAATARLEGHTWTRHIHEEFSWGVDWRGTLAAADGSVWFAAAVDSSGPRQHRAGLLQYREGQWIHHHQPGRAPTGGNDSDPATLLPATQRPEPIGKFLCLGESADGRTWAGRNLLVFQDGRQWQVFPHPLRPIGVIECMGTTRELDLWIGTRQFGALRYNGRDWQRFQGPGSLVANSVRSLAQTSDGSIWAATDRGFSRFDGHTWTADVLPEALLPPHEGGTLKAAHSGGLWINRCPPVWNRRGWPQSPGDDLSRDAFWTVACHFEGPPPDTVLIGGVRSVSQPGNLSVSWSGVAPWRGPKATQLEFSHRLDGQPWSPFSPLTGQAFFTLAPGSHRLEVRARDRDHNVDPTPAVLDFVVLPPAWRQGWFLLVMALLLGTVTTQSLRVVRERGRLRQTARDLAAEMDDRRKAEAEIRRLAEDLERRVQERTADLRLKKNELREHQHTLIRTVENLNARTLELEAANDRLKDLDRLKSLFIASMSHELRTPLNSIIGFSSILLSGWAGPLAAEQQENLAAVLRSGKHLLALINDVIDVSKVEAGKVDIAVEDFDLYDLIQEAAALVAKDARERGLQLEIHAAHSTARTDRRRLLQCVLNLISNAVKFTQRGSIGIAAGPTADGRHVEVAVNDTGIGIRPEDLERLFHPFVRLDSPLRTKVLGTGLGLYLTRKLTAEVLGGEVTVTSVLGQGSRFVLRVPRDLPRQSP